MRKHFTILGMLAAAICVIMFAGCGDDEEPTTPEHPDTGAAGDDDQDTGAPLPSDEETDSPRRGLCGLIGMAVLLATLLGLGFLRITRAWNVHKHGRIKDGR